MSQTTLSDEDLFGEAASEIRADVEAELEAAQEALPTSDDIWEVSADNVLGVLNTLRSSLDVEEAREHLHDAKKWFVIGRRAEAFEDEEDLEADLEAVETLIVDIEEARGSVGDLTRTIPELRNALDGSADGDGDEDPDDD